MLPRRLQREWLWGFTLVGLWGCRSHEADPELLVGGYAPPPAAIVQWPPPLEAPSPELESAVLAIENQSENESAPFTDSELTQVLDYHCGACHFPVEDESLGYEGLHYMDDMGLLIQTGKVIPGDGEASRLVLRMRLGEMPPVLSNTPPVPPSAVDRIVWYINLLPVLPPGTPAPAPEPPWQEEARNRPNVPPVDAACFRFLGDWIRCEELPWEERREVELTGTALEGCLEACRERPDCVAVTDYTWLNVPEFGCYLRLNDCDAPTGGVWQEEDAGRDYLKVCGSD